MKKKKTKKNLPPPHRFTRRSKLLALLFSTLAGVAIAEIAVRLLGTAPAFKPMVLTEASTVYKLSSNPLLGFELKANYRNEDANLVFSYPRTNSHGQRDVERTVRKKPGTKRIILLGDSVVEGEGLRRIDDTISRQLERLYREESVEVLNFGVSGYCTRAEVELLEVKGLKFQPDVVVVLFVKNDFNDFNTQLCQLDVHKKRPPVVRYLFTRSHLFRLLCVRLNLFLFGAQVDPGAWNHKAIGDNNVAEGLKRLAELAQRHNFKPLVAIWPDFENERILNRPTVPGTEDELIVERLAEMHGIPAVRLSKYFEEHWKNSERKFSPRIRYTVNGDTMHPSVEGAGIAAKGLKRELARLETGENTPPPITPTAETGSHYKVAIEAAKEEGLSNPDKSKLCNNTANILDSRGKTEQALKYYRKALALNPEHTLAHTNIATVLVKQGKLDKAVGHLQKALEQNPDLASAHYNLGIVMVSQGNRKGADLHIERALKLNPAFLKPHYKRALKDLVNRNYKRAILFLRQVLRVKPDHTEAHHNLGVAYMKTGLLTASLNCFRAALRLDLNRPETLKAAAWILATHPEAEKRNPQVAIKLAEKANRLTKGRDPAVLDTLAAAYAASGQFRRAVETAQSARKKASGNRPLLEKIQRRLKYYSQGKPYTSKVLRRQAAPAER